ncbi:uncharacterized protein E0L32_003973 [Thyridium curvatum]|uniref:Uncharacterized protein n=1 Tax=Thyridium curvatum TaxID=1093900 RepID=A0A507BCD8_9PEZI|nr:uncharacterized protein E0L32_003973 [Thyridium curvatum]TPX16324.1 hypothetical protein E0L32_003973 [Thyridium curvatum]
MALQTTWNLDQTSNSLIGVSKGALHAATTDNVQPLAILACEQFGNTLAMCPATLRKIEHSVLPAPEPRMLSFVKSTVGWSKNDCISYFGQNIAGLQFLGLAAALVTHRDLYRAAQTLQALLASTANDKTLLPTARQITHLLTSLESRCHLAGFADDVEGWRLLLAKHPSTSDPNVFSRLASPRPIPSSDAMVSLVDALRHLGRVGGADVMGITLTAGTGAPWIIGFVKWSLGQPPTIRCKANGGTLLEHPDSRVTVIISNGAVMDSPSPYIPLSTALPNYSFQGRANRTLGWLTSGRMGRGSCMIIDLLPVWPKRHFNRPCHRLYARQWWRFYVGHILEITGRRKVLPMGRFRTYLGPRSV